ncbi:MAG: RimK family protein [Desulfobulbaceae bacterium]|nr:RimK family protein [Desulfobulbaceae bacterium]
MTTLIIVEVLKNWPLDLPGVEIITARTYLTDPAYSHLRRVKVFNLCKSYRYQSAGYYVSLLAEARGHRPLPRLVTIQDMKSQTMVRFVSDDLDALIQKSMAPIQSDKFVLSIYFGRNLAKRYDRLSAELFAMFRAPLLRAQFSYQPQAKKWGLQSINPIAGSDIPDAHRPFVIDVATEFFSRQRQRVAKKQPARFELAILHNPDEEECPSNERALKRFIKAGAAMQLGVELITRADYGRLAEFDGLFIRETTNVNHHTYRFARRAAAEGLVVIDDPESILKCTNKVFLAELLEHHKVPIPKTMILHKDNLAEAEQVLGLPCILKKPDSYFSQGVVKALDREDLLAKGKRLLNDSELIIGQQFLPTPFDWRVGVLDKQPLFVCRYYMAKDHWQIIERKQDGTKKDEGLFDTIPIEEAPPKVIQTALKAANLIGDGLYGVDLKQVDNKVYVIEINDNPNIDAGIEDCYLKDEMYLRVMQYFLTRIERRAESTAGKP